MRDDWDLDPCRVLGLAPAFLADPARALDLGCLGELDGPAFQTDPGGDATAAAP